MARAPCTAGTRWPRTRAVRAASPHTAPGPPTSRRGRRAWRREPWCRAVNPRPDRPAPPGWPASILPPEPTIASSQDRTHLYEVVLRHREQCHARELLDPERPGAGSRERRQGARKHPHDDEQGRHPEREHEEIDEAQ